jgi:site-specific DNA-cytosine methylase
MKKVLYLASGHGIINHVDYEITYQDKYVNRDVIGDMLEIDLTNYDIIIATPPCNYWSRANYRRETSKYSQETKHLLPDILKKLNNQSKPFIVENVINKERMKDIISSSNCYYYEHGRHCYFSNILLNLSNVEQNVEYIQNIGSKNHSRQGGKNVKNVFEYFLETLKINEKR